MLPKKFLFFRVLVSSVLFSNFLFVPVTFAEKKAPVTRASSLDYEQRLVNIEHLLQNNGLLEILQQIELLQREVSQLRGEIEVNNYALNKMTKRQRNLYTDIDRRLQNMEGQSMTRTSTLVTPSLEKLGQIEIVNPPESETEAIALTLEQSKTDQQPQIDRAMEVTATTTEIETRTDPLQIKAKYQQAFKLLKKSQYNQAIKAFSKFVKTHPDSEYSDNAQYWMAEALYVKRQYEDAIREYKNLVSSYPDFQKVPQGLLKIGYSYQELGEFDTAKLWYIDVRQRFPGTTESRLADNRLKHMNDS